MKAWYNLTLFTSCIALSESRRYSEVILGCYSWNNAVYRVHYLWDRLIFRTKISIFHLTAKPWNFDCSCKTIETARFCTLLDYLTKKKKTLAGNCNDRVRSLTYVIKSNEFRSFQSLFTFWAPPSRVWTFENRMRNYRDAFSVVPLFAGIAFSAPERRKFFVRIIPWHSAFTDYRNKLRLSVSLLLNFRERKWVKKARVEAVEKMSSHCCTVKCRIWRIEAMQYRDKKSDSKNSTIIVVILALYLWYYDLETSTLFME